MLCRFVIRCVECRGGRVLVSMVGFLQGGAWWFLSVRSGILLVGCNYIFFKKNFF